VTGAQAVLPSGDRVGVPTRWSCQSASTVKGARRTLVRRDFEAAFATVDLIVAPTTPTVAFKLGEREDPMSMYLNDIFTLPVNLAGLPGLSLRCGFTAAGLPIGLQLIGRALDEARLLRGAYAYERATRWLERAPELG
jgi:aspartyl-tRNA(Asn)/glutamyl-tRNA(Gln) amidotransferase subunit A